MKPPAKFTAVARVGCRLAIRLCIQAFLVIAASQVAAGTDALPQWQRFVQLSDGRTFVTDGSLAVDAEAAKVGALPAEAQSEATARLVENYLAAPFEDEFRLADLSRDGTGAAYVSPTGIALNAIYVDFLSTRVPVERMRFRMADDSSPVIVTLDEKPIGLLMPLKR